MTKEKWAIVRKNLYLSLPQIQFLLGGTAIALSQEQWQAITALAAIWLLSPAMGLIASANVDMSKAINDDIRDFIHSDPESNRKDNPGIDRSGGGLA